MFSNGIWGEEQGPQVLNLHDPRLGRRELSKCWVLFVLYFLTVEAILPAEAYHLNRSHSYMEHYKTGTFVGHTVSGKSLKTIVLVTAKGLCAWRGTWHVHVWGCTFVCWHTYMYAHTCVDAREPPRVLLLWHLPFSLSWNSPCR